ncbi:type VI secretion system membrane subunit TssM [Glaciecola sp. 1036]|uniref:type VI secretion system membrane subunit TssM n=1 Tax=Alteromonadaceae TaxID=72275 RepID=UPI003CFE4544
MDKLTTIWQKPWVKPALSLFFISLIILIAGPYIAIAGFVPLESIFTRLAICILLIASYALYRYIRHLKLQSQQSQLVEAMSGQDDASSAIDAESHALKDKFTQAFESLKHTKGGRTSLVEMPWFMIIGSPGSGKTTLLSNSGLSFPLADKLNTKHFNGIAGTKNCDWWISNNAVLLDTAGRYTSQDSYQEVDASGWQKFLSLIKRYRKKPISGLLVSISMLDILNMNEYELSQHVNQLKQRISEVNQYFKTQFPVYLLLTKADMLAGFTQFYDTYSHKEREQAFGFTFEKQSQGSQQQIPDIDDQFEQKFSQLLASVTRRQWQRMSLERDAQRKASIYAFTDQLASLQATIKNLVCQLSSQESNIQTKLTPGLVRGVYFTSGTQNGAPIDRMMAHVSQNFGLRLTRHASWNKDERSYFIKDLLEQVVFKEADQFGTLSSYENRKKRLKQVALAGLTAISMGLCSLFYTSFALNAEFIEQTDSVVERWQNDFALSGEAFSSPVDRLIENLPSLQQLNNQIQGLKSAQSNSLAGFGLNQASSINNALQESYERLLKQIVLPHIERQLIANMQDPSSPVKQYKALKAYLMFTQPEFVDQAYLTQYLLTETNQDNRLNSQEFQALIPHLNALAKSELLFDQVNNDLVANVRDVLKSQELSDIYYQEFRDTYISRPGFYLSMSQLAGPDWRGVLTSSIDEVRTLSRLYTPEVFDQIEQQGKEDFVQQVERNAWVLGPDNLIDTKGLKNKFLSMYAQDYANQWQNLLASIAVRNDVSLAGLLTMLPILTENSNPMFTLLESVAKATDLSNFDLPTLPNTSATQQLNQSLSFAKSTLDGQSPTNFVSSRFEKLHQLMKKEKRQAVEQRMIALLQEVQIALNLQQNGKDGGNTNSLIALEGFGFIQDAPLNRWVEQLTSAIKRGQSQIRKDQLANIWKTQVAPICSAITNGKYPFASSANTDASLQDITQLFSSKGAIFSFFNQHLAELVNTQTLRWQWLPGVQEKFNFAPEVLVFFQQSFELQQNLFAKNPNTPSLEYIFTPVFLDPSLSQVRLEIFDTLMNYQFGRPTPKTVNWPPQNPLKDSKIIFIRRDGSEISYGQSGLFSLTKLLKDSEIKQLSSNKVQVTFTHQGFSTIYEIASSNGDNPLVLNQLANYQCLTDI